jgi:hypothetical protein
MLFKKILAECQSLYLQISLDEDGTVLEYGALPITMRLLCCPHLEEPTSPKIFVLCGT